MPKTLDTTLRLIQAGKTPPVILIGGSSEFLAEKAFISIRDAIVAANPAVSIEAFDPGTELSSVLDSYRTMSLFGGARLIVLPEVTAFISRKEISSLYDKVVSDWKSAKTDRKRATTAAKMLHVIGLVGADLEMTDSAVADAIGIPPSDTVFGDVLAFCRASGKKATRGEGDAALLLESLTRGGAKGTTLLLRTGELPAESATLDLIERQGAVISCDLGRGEVTAALDHAVAELAVGAGVTFDSRALGRLRQKLGIDRLLADKFSKEVPDLRAALSEAERLVTLAGRGGRVTSDLIDREIASVEGGARYELGSLFSEGKIIEAIAKLRDLVGQMRREDPKTTVEIHYGKFIFNLADEVRQMIGIISFARTAGIDLKRGMQYNRFKDSLADRLGDALKANGIVRQRPHPFPLFKRFEAARSHTEAKLFEALAELAQIDIDRKSGGLPADLAIEAFLLRRVVP
jgi:DNA polymerase III delta subunit